MGPCGREVLQRLQRVMLFPGDYKHITHHSPVHCVHGGGDCAIRPDYEIFIPYPDGATTLEWRQLRICSRYSYMN